MGVVYRALDTNLNRPVAIKVLSDELADSAARRRFQRVPLRPGQILPLLPPAGIRSSEDAAAVPGARAFAVPGAFAGPTPSVYAYSKVSKQRNIFRVAVP